jgi:hypothetical protein
MKKHTKILVYGLLIWLIPFIVSFLFVDAQGNFMIPETFFKSIMVVSGAFIGVILAVRYFKDVKGDYVKEGMILGAVWLIINLAIDLVFVQAGFFKMSVTAYFTDIGLRYLSIPIYTIGLGYALKQRR